ncbi:MAG: serine/threonine protein phosphatase [Myxococcota bacterium]
MSRSPCNRMTRIARVVAPLAAVLVAAFGCAGPAHEHAAASAPPAPFTIAMIPDTQNYVDFTHQKDHGFAIDAADLMRQHLGWVAAHGIRNGGDVAFVASVGDVWQHQSLPIDPEHAAKGIDWVVNPFFRGHFDPTPMVREFEIPQAVAAYQQIADAGIPFGVPPGNHDHDAMYTVSTHPPNLTKPPRELTMTKEDLGLLHIGGLTNFLSAFGEDTPFFKDKPWYVAAYAGGTSSAQTFTAGGYTFLHIALEMQAGDAVLDWARGVIAAHPGLPTIVSTHDYMTPNAERVSGGFLDLTVVDPERHNTPQQTFEKFLSQQDQIFLVLCGHYHGQAYRVDTNAAGHDLYQVLADYQDRGQVGIDAGQPNGGGLGGGPTGLGDGWLRLLHFDLAADPPTISMRTYSTHYGVLSSELPEYAAWYRPHEQPKMSDAEFLAAEEYEIVMRDFRARFGPPGAARD